MPERRVGPWSITTWPVSTAVLVGKSYRAASAVILTSWYSMTTSSLPSQNWSFSKCTGFLV